MWKADVSNLVFSGLVLIVCVLVQTVIEAPAEVLWNILYPGEQTAEWSPGVALNEVIDTAALSLACAQG